MLFEGRETDFSCHRLVNRKESLGASATADPLPRSHGEAASQTRPVGSRSRPERPPTHTDGAREDRTVARDAGCPFSHFDAIVPHRIFEQARANTGHNVDGGTAVVRHLVGGEGSTFTLSHGR